MWFWKNRNLVKCYVPIFKKKLRIGFIIPRQALVEEIWNRLKTYFFNNNITKCYDKMSPELGDIVILTAHKSRFYINQFDLVIIDEIDAFPLSEDIVLQKIVLNLARSKTIVISATPPSYLHKLNFKTYKLFKRFHGNALPTPTFIKTYFLKQNLKKLLCNIDKKYIVYFPTIKAQLLYYKYFKKIFKIILINSKTFNTKKALLLFRIDKFRIIFSTSILERGVTFKKVNVIIIDADHELFTTNVLEQICGRVGRFIKYPKGDIWLLGKTKTKNVKEVIKRINNYNSMHNM